MLIGICGKSGCGKSSLAQEIIRLTSNRTVHLDIDKVGHSVLLITEVQEELINSFGSDVVKENVVDRRILGEIVFNSKSKMDKLTDITWKYMQMEIDKFIESNKDKIVILDWLLLPKSKYFKMCDIRILLDVPYEIRKERAMKRDNITDETFDLREKASIDYYQEEFDYVFKTSDDIGVKRMVKSL